jgi:hypothetical protein
MISPSIALALWIAVWGLAPSQPRPPTPSKPSQEIQTVGEQQSRASKTANDQTQPVITPLSESQRESTKEKQEDCTTKAKQEPAIPWWNNDARLLSIFTLALVLVAVLQFCAMRKQAKYMRHALRDGKKAADAAKQSADAATQSVASLKVFNRARIRVDNVTFIDVEKHETDTFRFSHDFANVGPTNGHIFEQLDSIWVYQGDLPDEPPYTPPVSQNYGVSPQGAIQWKSDPISKSTHQIARVLAGETTLYAFGFVRYRDEFGDNHETRYAVRYRMNGELPALVPKAGYNESN